MRTAEKGPVCVPRAPSYHGRERTTVLARNAAHEFAATPLSGSDQRQEPASAKITPKDWHRSDRMFDDVAVTEILAAALL